MPRIFDGKVKAVLIGLLVAWPVVGLGSALMVRNLEGNVARSNKTAKQRETPNQSEQVELPADVIRYGP